MIILMVDVFSALSSSNVWNVSYIFKKTHHMNSNTVTFDDAQQVSDHIVDVLKRSEIDFPQIKLFIETKGAGISVATYVKKKLSDMGFTYDYNTGVISNKDEAIKIKGTTFEAKLLEDNIITLTHFIAEDINVDVSPVILQDAVHELQELLNAQHTLQKLKTGNLEIII